MSREWALQPTALDRAREDLGPMWFDRAALVFQSLRVDGDPGKSARHLERKRLRACIDALKEAGLREALRVALNEHERRRPSWAQAARLPDPSEVNRSELVRVLASSWRTNEPPFPGATAWAYFDVGHGMTDPPRDLAGWRRLVATWGTELRKVDLGTKTARKRLRVKS